MKVDVSTSSPILRMEVSTNDFGRLFANMAADEQVAVLQSMIDHMSAHPVQWDHIAIELEEIQNIPLRSALSGIFSIS